MNDWTTKEAAKDLEIRIERKRQSIRKASAALRDMENALHHLCATAIKEEPRHICGADGTVGLGGCAECRKLDEYIAEQAAERGER